jgi:hypothetical protein
MKIIAWFRKLIQDHGTKLIGFVGVTIGVLAAADPEIVGGPKAIKWYLLISSLLTVWRGFFLTAKQKEATTLTKEPADADHSIT